MKKYYIFFFLLTISLSNVFSQSKPLDISNVLINFSNYQQISEKNTINGYAGLDSNGLILPSNLFPNFSSQPNGTIWVKSGTSFSPLSGGLSASSSGLSSNGVFIGEISPSVYGISLDPSVASGIAIKGGTSNKIYLSPLNTIGGAQNASHNSYSWKIDSGGSFVLSSGTFNGDISLNSNKLLNTSRITSANLNINLATSTIDSLVSPITLSSGAGVFVPNVSISTSSGAYALNLDSADLRYIKILSSNNWTTPQTFSGPVTFTSPISVSNGGTGVSNLGALKTVLGIDNLPSGTYLNKLASLTPAINNIIIGSTGSGGGQEWALASPSVARTKLGLNIGTDVQPYNQYLSAIANSATNPSTTLLGEKYFFILNGGTNVFERTPFTTLKSYLNISTYGDSLISSSNVNTAQATLQVRPGFDVQPYSAVLTNMANLTYTGSSTFTVLGNVTTGQWNATKIAPSYGGTGSSSIPTPGQVLIGNSSGTYTPAQINGTPNQVIVSSSSGLVSISTPQDIGTLSSPVFNSLTLTQANGTQPFLVSSSTVVTNLNADLLDGLSSSDFQPSNSTLTNVSNGSYTGALSINTVGTITTGTWNATTIEISNGGTGATTQAAARTNLGVTATGLDSTYLKVSNDLSDLTSDSTARTNLGIGSGITGNKTFVDQSGTTHTITIVNGVITSWTP